MVRQMIKNPSPPHPISQLSCLHTTLDTVCPVSFVFLVFPGSWIHPPPPKKHHDRKKGPVLLHPHRPKGRAERPGHEACQAGREKAGGLTVPSLDRLSLSPSLVPVTWVCGTPISTAGFPGGLGVKNWPANEEDVGLVPGSGRSPGERIHGQRGLAGYSPQGYRVGHGGGIRQQQ